MTGHRTKDPTPPTTSRAIVPFWFWNGDQQEDELERQLGLAAAGGYGGLAIHARSGNRTPYLSQRWLELVRFACDRAAALGLHIWLYDEEGYPSGTAGHTLQRDRPAWQQQSLCFYYASPEAVNEGVDLVRAFPTPDGDLLVFARRRLKRYVDTLNPAVAPAFIRATLDAYATVLGTHMGRTVTRVYTDDLNLHMQEQPGLPYTDDLDSVFRARFGYSLLDNLPALVENLEGCEQIRVDYRGLVQELFLERFVQPMVAWCDAHGVGLTGHLRGDEGPLARTVSELSSVMPFLAREHVPGVDDYLGVLPGADYTREVFNRMGLSPIVLLKQASSVAHQFGNGRCNAECLASIGWGASPATMDRMMRLEMVLGINEFTPHAVSYATAGVAKRDHPPSLFFQQPYWPRFKGLLEEWAQTADALAEGEPETPVLVLQPAVAAWAALDGADIIAGFVPRTKRSRQSVQEIDRALAELALRLMREHVGFDFGDEVLCRDSASVEGRQLRLGQARYDRVIVPPCTRLLPTTVTLLNTLTAAGGIVHVSAPTPDGLHGTSPLPDKLPALVEGESADVWVQARNLPDGRRLLFRADFREPALRCDGTEVSGPWSIVAEHSNALALTPGKDGRVSLTLLAPCTPLWLYAEQLDLIKLQINDASVAVVERSRHPATPDLQGVQVSLRPGVNRIDITAPVDCALEPLWLVGAFRVVGEHQLAPPAEAALQMGDVATQGLPNYWGTVLYRTNVVGPAAAVDLGSVDGVVDVLLDGVVVGTCLKPPYRIPVAMGLGVHCLEVRLYPTAGNFFGPVSRPQEGPWPFGVHGPVRLIQENRVPTEVIP